MKKIKTFLSDGIDQRDFLLLIFSGLFAIVISAAIVKALLGQDIENLLKIISAMDSPLMVIIGSIMGLQAVSVISNGRKSDLKYNSGKMEQSKEDLLIPREGYTDDGYVYQEESITHKPIQEDLYTEDNQQGRI